MRGVRASRADRGKIVCKCADVLYTKCCLDRGKFEVARHIAHVVKDIDRELPLLLGFTELVYEESHLLRRLQPELGEAQDAHVDPGQVPIRSGDGIEEVPEDLRLVDLATHSDRIFPDCI